MIEIHGFATSRACLITSALLLFSAFCYLRHTEMTGRMRIRLEARLNERERIARELHDTLLQSFHGLILRFQAAAEEIQPSGVARKRLEEALDLADEVLSDCRDRVVDLRACGAASDIPRDIMIAAKRILEQSGTVFNVTIDGRSHELQPIVRQEVLRVMEEAVFNAARHANAESIDASVAYLPRELRVCIRDNGVGMDPALLYRGCKKRFGMIGMHERALKIYGRCVVTSRSGFGTEVTLSIPASIAYRRSSSNIWGRPYCWWIRVNETLIWKN